MFDFKSTVATLMYISVVHTLPLCPKCIRVGVLLQPIYDTSPVCTLVGRMLSSHAQSAAISSEEALKFDLFKTSAQLPKS